MYHAFNIVTGYTYRYTHKYTVTRHKYTVTRTNRCTHTHNTQVNRTRAYLTPHFTALFRMECERHFVSGPPTYVNN